MQPHLMIALPTKKGERTPFSCGLVWSQKRQQTKGSGGSLELDTIPGRQSRALTQEVIEQHVDRRALEQTKRTEELERETIEHVIGNLGLV